MSLTVTATASGTGTYDGIALTVKALTGAAASPAGATAESATVTTPELSITPQASGSWVYGALAGSDASADYTAASGTTFSQNQYWSADTYGFGTFRSTSTTTESDAVTLGATAPTGPDGALQIALLEILAASGKTLAEDSSSPATAYTTAAETVSTASFTPPAGSLLVAMVSSDCSGTSGDSMTMTVSDSSGLTWTRQAVADYVSGSGTFQVASVWTAPVPGSGGLSVSSTGTGDWGDIALVFSGSGGTGASASDTGSGAGSVSITTTGDHSAIAVLVLDAAAVSGAGREWLTVNGTTPTAGNGYELDYTLGTYGAYAAWWPDTGPAGTYDVGLSAPAGMTYTVIAVEVLATGLTTPAALTVSPAFTGSRSGGAGLGALTRTAALTVTPSFTAAASAGGLIQETSGSTTGDSLTLTLPAEVTIGNGVIIAVSGFRGSTISGITLGGTGSLFTEAAGSGSDDYNAQVWYCSAASVSSDEIVITAGADGIIAYAYEVDGTASLDKSEPGYASSGTALASGSTAATLGAAEFIAGIAATTGTGSVTVTGPAGWTNETAIDEVTAGSYYYSAVSGYKLQGSTRASYDYTAAASASAGWGAVCATFLLMPVQAGWGGVVFDEHDSYTGVSATFTIPELSGETGALCSIWVGLGNVYQTGIYLGYDTSSSGNASTRPWSWWLPGAGENWNAAQFPTKAGDSLTLTMELTSTDWLMTITSNTEDWSYTEVKSVLAVNVGSIQDNAAGPAFWPYPCSQAEIIIEKEGSDSNPDYGSVEFTSVATTPAISRAPEPLATVNTDIDQYPGPFDVAGGSFTMYWNAYS